MADGLERRPVPILLRGLDQGQPGQAAVVGTLDLLQNMVLVKNGDGVVEFMPRPGTTNVSKTADIGTITSGMRLGTLGPALLLLTGTSCYRKATDQWHLVDQTAPVIGVDTKPIGSGAIVGESSDYAYVNGFTIGVVSYYDGKLWAVRVEVSDSTGATVFSTIVDTSAVSVIGATKIAVSGTSAVVFWGDSETGSLLAAKFDSTAPSALGSPVTVTTADAGLQYDVQTVGSTGKIAIAYSSGSAIAQRLVTVSSMAVSGATAYATLNNLVTFGYLTNNYSSNTIYLGTISFTAGLQVSTFDGTTLALGATTVFDAASTFGFNLSGYRAGASVTVYFSSAPHAPPGIPACDYMIKTSTGSAATIVARSVMLASRVVPVGTTFYALVEQRAGTDAARGTSGTYFLMDLGQAKTIGMALKDTATPRFYVNGTNHLQNMATGASGSVLLTAGLKVIAVATDNGQFAPYIMGAGIIFTLQDSTVGRPVELNAGLHIPGAQPYLYDGLTLTEHGFPIGPDPAESLTPAAGGGMTPAVTYTYIYVDEWTDGAGNLWRSRLSRPQTVTMGASDTQVTHSMPTLRITRKTSISRAVYRTLADGDGTAYFKVSSTTAPTFNDPTVDRITFVDTVSDATAAAGEPLYTNNQPGSELENIATPACRSFAVHRGRLLAAGIEGDTGAVWFSKDVKPGFGVEFSDFLISRISSVEPIKSVGSFDSYAVACTATQTWGSVNEYPDDTGGGGVLVFQQTSDTTGCAATGMLVHNDQGIMTYAGDKGLWRSSRGLSWDFVGSQIEDDMITMGTPAVMFAVPLSTQIRVAGGTTVLVHEAVYGTWSRWSYPGAPGSIVDATVWNGSPVYLCADGTVMQESDAIYADNGTMPEHRCELQDMNLFGVGAFGRLYIAQLIGRALGAGGFTLNIDQTFDKVAIATKRLVYTGSETELNAEVDPGTMGKASRWNMTIYDSSNGSNSAFTIVGITALVGLKPGLNRLPVARRAT